jgi:ABC-type antimicrobial peptide transport system permease subunit
MVLLGTLGVLGVIIAAVGVFGVMAYAVERQHREIGVRISLGASPAAIVAMVLTGAATLIGCGLLIGVAAAWYVSSFARAFLFQIQPTDVRVFTAAAALLAAVGLAAALIPARRAARIDPMVILRLE